MKLNHDGKVLIVTKYNLEKEQLSIQVAQRINFFCGPFTLTEFHQNFSIDQELY